MSLDRQENTVDSNTSKALFLLFTSFRLVLLWLMMLIVIRFSGLEKMIRQKCA